MEHKLVASREWHGRFSVVGAIGSVTAQNHGKGDSGTASSKRIAKGPLVGGENPVPSKPLPVHPT
jgi:hypothetical protein